MMHMPLTEANSGTPLGIQDRDKSQRGCCGAVPAKKTLCCLGGEPIPLCTWNRESQVVSSE